jgi:hypothetical protein
MQEARNSSGAITSQYFALGQTINGTSYFYQLNHRGDNVAVANTSGTVVSSQVRALLEPGSQVRVRVRVRVLVLLRLVLGALALELQQRQVQ